MLNLLEVAMVKLMAHQIGITNISEKSGQLILEVKKDAAINPVLIPDLIKTYKGKLKFTLVERPHFTYRLDQTKRKEIFRHIKSVLQDINGLKD